ncbi:MAG: hypothetical protein RM049_17060 [Nostoc sp. DedQUE04]|nr:MULTISPECIES: hypothetical protein [unclassified Nostoc]MDZ8127394.1 hypothetical protein [Nostoc sp. DedQUE07]MDZ8136992.1 hypothetical protein [Nostoc sp. DedQUE04]
MCSELGEALELKFNYKTRITGITDTFAPTTHLAWLLLLHL